MNATRKYKCDCGCDGVINPGDQFVIREGYFYRAEHSTIDLLFGEGFEPNTKPVRKEKEILQRGLSDLPLFDPCPIVQQSLF